MDGLLVSIKTLQRAAKSVVFFHLHNDAAYPCNTRDILIEVDIFILKIAMT